MDSERVVGTEGLAVVGVVTVHDFRMEPYVDHPPLELFSAEPARTFLSSSRSLAVQCSSPSKPRLKNNDVRGFSGWRWVLVAERHPLVNVDIISNVNHGDYFARSILKVGLII